jgi:hypothetical protein
MKTNLSTLGGLAIPTSEIFHHGKSSPGLRTLSFMFMAWKITPHIWEREVVTKVRKLYE